MTPLANSISTRIATLNIPLPAYGDETPPDDGKAQISAFDAPVVGEVPPDWGPIEEKAGIPREDSTSSGSKSQEEPEKAKEPVQEPAKEPEKKVEEPKKEPEPEKKAAEPAKEPEAKELEGAAKEPEQAALPSDEEIEAMQPLPGTTTAQRVHFGKMKDLLKIAVADNKRLNGEIATVKTSIPPPEALEELETLRKTNSELKERVEAFYLDSDPEVVKPLKEAQDSFWDWLVNDERLTLPEEKAEAYRKLDPNGPEGHAKLVELLNKVKGKREPDSILEAELTTRILNYKQAHKDHGKRLEELKSKRGDFEKERSEQEVKKQQEWAGEAAAELRAQAKDAAWWGRKSGTTPEDLAHNKRFDEKIAPQLQSGITAMWTHDTKEAMKVVYKALAHDMVAEERDELKTKLEEAEKRIAELDSDAKGVKRISSPSRTAITNPEKQKAAIETHTDRETTAEEAFQQWQAGRR